MNIKEAERIIKQHYGKQFDTTRWDLYQKPVMEKILEPESSVLGLLPTGTGKSLLFQFFAGFNYEDGITIVIEPLQSIIEDQFNRFNNDFGNGRAGKADALSRSIIDNGISILFLSPEQLYKYATILFSLLKKGLKIQMVVIDEVHTLLDWGLSFRSEFLYIQSFIKIVKHYNQSLKVLALTATLNPAEIELCMSFLGINTPPIDRRNIETKNVSSIPNVVCIDGGLENSFEKVLNHIADRHNLARMRGSEIVFFKEYKYIEKYLEYLSASIDPRYRIEISNQCEYIYNIINKRKNATRFLLMEFKGDLPFKDKQHLLDVIDRGTSNPDYIEGSYQCYILATKALAMGVDLKSVWHVRIVGLPESWNYYLQEIGRIRQGKGNNVDIFYSSIDAVSFLKKIETNNNDSFVNAIERIKLWNYLCLWEWILDLINGEESVSPKDVELTLEKLLAKKAVDIREKLEKIIEKDRGINTKDINIYGFDPLFSSALKIEDIKVNPLISYNFSKAFISFDKQKYPGIFNGGKGSVITYQKDIEGEKRCVLEAEIENDADGRLNFIDYIVFNAMYTFHISSVDGISKEEILKIILGREYNVSEAEVLLDLIENSISKIKATQISIHYTDGKRLDSKCALYKDGVFPILRLIPELQKDVTALDTGKIRQLFNSLNGRRYNYTPVNIISVYYSILGLERHKQLHKTMAKRGKNYSRFLIPCKLPSIENALVEWLNHCNKGQCQNKDQEIARLKRKMKRIIALEYSFEHKSDFVSNGDKSFEDEYDRIVRMAYGIASYSKKIKRAEDTASRNKIKSFIDKQEKQMKEDMSKYLISYIPTKTATRN